jgi:hypothetical protein
MTDAEARATLFEYEVVKLNLPKPIRRDINGKITYPGWLGVHVFVTLTDDGEYVKIVNIKTYDAQASDFLIAVHVATQYFASEIFNPFADYYYLRISGEQERYGAFESDGLKWVYRFSYDDGEPDFVLVCSDR